MGNYSAIQLDLLKKQITRLIEYQAKIQCFINREPKMNPSLYQSYIKLYKYQQEKLSMLQQIYEDTICYLDRIGPPYGRDVFSDRFF